MEPVLSREEVAALLQGLAEERQDSEGFKGKRVTIPGAEGVGPRDGILTRFKPIDQGSGNDTNDTP